MYIFQSRSWKLRSLHFNLLLFELKIKEEELGITKTFVNNLRVRIFMYTLSATGMRVRYFYYLHIPLRKN
jgi:hypothetical protein